MTVAPMIATHIATQNALNTARLAAVNSAKAAHNDDDYDPVPSDGSGLMFVLCCIGGVVLITTMALLLL